MDIIGSNVCRRLLTNIRKKIIHFLILTSIGFLSIAGLEVLSKTQAGAVVVNKVYDEFIKRYAINSIRHLKSINTLSDGNCLVYVDIDDSTYSEWGSPLITPRDKLSLILRQTYKSGAKVVILDIDIDSASNVLNDDYLLKKTIYDLSNDNKNTYLILPKRIKNNKPFKGMLDNIVNSSHNIFFAVPSFYLSSTDNVARFWSPYREYNNKVIWHTSMLAVILLENNFSGIKDKLEGNILHKDHHVKNLMTKYRSNINHRIYFSDIPADTISNYSLGNMFMNRLTYRDIDKTDLSNKVVIIGNSSPDFGDIHSTPIGTMPGMYIIGNIIKTINNYKSLSGTSDWLVLMANVFIIIVTSLVITLIDKNWLQFVFYIFWFLFLIWICSIIFISYNVIIIAPIGVLTICAYEGVSDFEHWLSSLYCKLRPGGGL